MIDGSDRSGNQVKIFASLIIRAKRNGLFRCDVTRGSVEREVNKNGQAGWEGNKISFGEANRGPIDHEVNKNAA